MHLGNEYARNDQLGSGIFIEFPGIFLVGKTSFLEAIIFFMRSKKKKLNRNPNTPKHRKMYSQSDTVTLVPQKKVIVKRKELKYLRANRRNFDGQGGENQRNLTTEKQKEKKGHSLLLR